jgi:hypothetical protein
VTRCDPDNYQALVILYDSPDMPYV